MKNSIKHLFMLCLFWMISIVAQATEIPNNQIWYEASAQLKETTSTFSYGLHTNAFNTTIKSHSFSEGKGIITFDTDVTSIGRNAFYGCSGLISVTIPNSVTSIGESAFEDCSGLTSVTIPNSVTSIGNHAFDGCNSLPEENNLRYADTYLVEAVNKTLSTYTIKEGTKWIGYDAFFECSGLTSVTIPNSVTSIGSYAFYLCSGLTSVTIPNSVTSIGESAFGLCSSLTSVYITNLDKWAEIEFGNSYANPLYYAHSLYLDEQLVTEAKLTTATKIGDYAFDGCSGLTSVTIPNSVTSIGKGAFEDCKGLTSVTIPNSVTSIGYGAFDGCSAMRSVYVGWDKESDIPSVGYYTFPYSKCTLYVPQGAGELYLAKEYWKTFKSIYGGLIIEDKDGNKTSVPIADSNPSFTLSDDINSINNSGIIKDVTITYNRNFEKAGVWQAWYMPFDVAFDDMKEAYDVAQIHGVLLDKDNNAVLAFLKLDEGKVKANTPYVVRPKKSGEVSIVTKTNLQIHPTSFYMMSATDKYTIGGVFEKTTTPGNWYALNLDGQFQLMGSGVYLRPFRIYMTIDPRTDNPYAQSASTTAKMDIVVIGDDETTGIESLTPALSEGKGAIYNLSGLRVNSIQKGQIYIMNGKKYIAK